MKNEKKINKIIRAIEKKGKQIKRGRCWLKEI
jgi:hypothetical protein